MTVGFDVLITFFFDELKPFSGFCITQTFTNFSAEPQSKDFSSSERHKQKP